MGHKLSKEEKRSREMRMSKNKWLRERWVRETRGKLIKEDNDKETQSG